MTVWDKPISWSKLKMAIDCPKQLGLEIDKVPRSDIGPNYWMELGKWVQKCFELYFNQRVNLNPNGRSDAVINRVVDKVFASPSFTSCDISYPADKDLEILKKEIREQVLAGVELFRKDDLLHLPFDSEVKWRGTFRGMRTFAMIDFLGTEPKGLIVLDGKGHSKENADPNQVLYYVLTLASSGKNVTRAGLMYWRFATNWLDVSPAAIKAFVDGPFAEARPTLDRLRTGASDLPARPSKEKCGYCSWKRSCVDSAYKPPLASFPPGTEEVGLEVFGV